MGQDPLRYFRVEARELVDQLSQGALDLDRGADPELVARLLRFAHTLKGAARVVRQAAMAEQAHAVEELLVPYRDGAAAVPTEVVGSLLRLTDALGEAVAALDPPPAAATGPASTDPVTAPAGTGAAGAPTGGPVTAAEARRTAAEPPPAARADGTDVDEVLEAVGEAHARFRTLRRRVESVQQLRRSAELLADQLRGRAGPAGGADPADRTGGVGRPAALRLAEELAALERQFTDGAQQVERELEEVHGRAERLRLATAGTIFTALHRAVRDVAEAQGKRVVFTGRGGELRLDPQVLTQVSSALLHVVRNAVAHGIEPPDERRGAGKAVEGSVVVQVQRQSGRAVFACRDDGRGLDLAAVRRAAAAKGYAVPAAAEQDPTALLDLLLRGGISTAESVTGVSGRGIGLDVVRDVAEQLGGTVRIRTEPGTGTSVELDVPLSLVSLNGLVVQAGAAAVTLPLDAVRTCLRLTADEVARAAAAAALPHDGHVLPYLPLCRMLPRSDPTPAAPGVAVVLTAANGAAAVGVDRLLGTATSVARPVPPLTPVDPVVGGLSVDAEGNPRIVLDPQALVAGALGGAPTDPAESATGGNDGPAAVLVVDDSLTTRMLERSILESAGYEVDVAASGEEGLAKAAQRRYALFLVDIDMPGIDGFTFVQRTRNDPALCDTPAILVSSRATAEDRRRGAAAGARAYVVKSEFNQQELLEHIRRLVGR